MALKKPYELKQVFCFYIAQQHLHEARLGTA